MQRTGQPNVFLDITHEDDQWLEKRFPSIHAHVSKFGLHLGRNHIPVAPACHYHCGGVVVDLNGRTNVPGLFAAGEVTCTGLHGANRLASTSLLEGLVWGKSLGKAIIDEGLQTVEDLGAPVATNQSSIDPSVVSNLWTNLQTAMQTHVGVARSESGLTTGVAELHQIKSEARKLYNACKTRQLASLCNAAETSTMVAEAALANRESRGSHYRAAEEAESARVTQKVHASTGSTIFVSFKFQVLFV